MQTPFYASGFLYNQKTQQICLVQPETDSETPVWSTLCGDGMEAEDARMAFQRVINKHLNINLNPKNIYPIYDYFHDSHNKFNYVFYAEVKSNKAGASWFSFAQISKLKFTAQTKQDIMVGERVINAKWRDDEAKRESLILGA